MPGIVYVFNLYNEPITNLNVGGFSAGSISGYANGGNAPIYTPASLAVPRTQYPAGSAAFAVGDNRVMLPWNSFQGLTTVTIPDPGSSPVGPNDPLILLLAVNNAMLLSTRGYLLATFGVQLANAMQVAAESEPA